MTATLGMDMTKAKAKTEIRLPYGTRKRHQTPSEGASKTKQSFRDESDVNKILAKYQATGLVTHVNELQAQYGFATSNDFRESMELIRKGKELFAALPSQVRAYFDQSVENFLDYMQDPDNAGLLENPEDWIKDEENPVPIDREKGAYSPLQAASKNDAESVPGATEDDTSEPHS